MEFRTLDTTHSTSTTIDLLMLKQVFVDGRKTIVLWTIGGFAIALSYAIFASPLYSSSVLVQPITPPGEGSALSGAQSLGGLSTLIGLSGLRGSGDNIEANIAVLNSRGFFDSFIIQQNMLPVLFSDRWDRENNDWLPETKLSRWIRRTKEFVLSNHSNRDNNEIDSGQPSLWDAYELISEIKTVDRDAATGLLRISIEWKDPRIAALWVNKIVSAANAFIRQRDLAEAEKAIKYLRGQIQLTQETALVDGLAVLAEQQMQKRMLAEIRDDYAFRVLDAGVAAEESHRPKRVLAILLGLIAGCFMGGLVVTFKNFGEFSTSRKISPVEPESAG